MHRTSFLMLHLVLPLLACGGSSPPDAAAPPPDGAAPASEAQRLLAIDGATDLRLAPGGSAPLRAVLSEGGRPLPGVPIVFAFGGPSAGASLGALRVETDDWGRVATTLTAAAEARLSVTATAEGAAPVSWSALVVREKQGELDVVARFAGSGSPPALGGGRARAYPSSVACGDIVPRGTPPAALLEAALPAPGETVHLGRLDAGRYTVTASFDDSARPMARVFGCLQGVEVVGGETRLASVGVEPLPVSVAGPYRVVSFYDFTKALPGALGELARAFAAAFEDLGTFLADLLVRTLFDSSEPFAVAVLAPLIDSVIASVPWLSRIADAGAALAEVLTHLEVHSAMILDRNSEGGLMGHERWEALVVHYRGQPYRFATTDPRLAPLGGAPTVSFEMPFSQTSDRLLFSPHPVQLAYGSLALLVFEEVILPAFTGLTGLRAVLGELVDCSGLASSLADVGLSIPASACEAVLDAADGVLRASLRSLVASPSSLTRRGSARAVDRDLDVAGLADVLEGGTWEGTLDVDEEHLSFSATWSGERNVVR